MVIALLLAGVAPGFGAPSAAETLTALQSLAIKTGPYSGALRLSARGGVNWYFSNIALANALPALPGTTREYLDAYLKHADPGLGTIDDVAALENGTFGALQPSDSHDAYAATFIALAARYVAATHDAAWWREHRDAVKAIAYQNILVQIKPNGLVRVYQSGKQPRGVDAHEAAIGYLIDNCEVYDGLRSLIAQLRTDHDADAAYYETFLAPLGKAIATLFDESTGAWRPSDDVPSVKALFYPDCLAQVYPGLYHVSSGDPVADKRRATSSYRFLRRCRIPDDAQASQRLSVAVYAATTHDAAFAKSIVGAALDDFTLPALAWRIMYVKASPT